MKSHSESYVKYSSRVPLLLLTVEKLEHENFDLLFVFLPFFLLPFPYAKLKKCMAYTNDLHTKQMLYHQRSSFCWLEQHAS